MDEKILHYFSSLFISYFISHLNRKLSSSAYRRYNFQNPVSFSVICETHDKQYCVTEPFRSEANDTSHLQFIISLTISRLFLIFNVCEDTFSLKSDYSEIKPGKYI